MAIKVCPNVIQITAHGTVAGRPWASVWHMNAEDGIFGSGPGPEDVVRDFADNFQDHLLNNISVHVVLTNFTWLALDNAEGATGVMAPNPAKLTAGTWNRDIAGPAMAMLIRKQSSSRRGARNGRAYMPGVTEEQMDNAGNILGTWQTSYNAQLQAFLDGISDDTALDAAGRYPVVTHFPPAAREKGPQIVEGTKTRITSLTLDGRAATQRRRLRG
jgi:hypothetical protein